MMMFGKVAGKVDGVLKSSTNRYLVRLDTLEEAMIALSTSPTVDSDQPPQDPLPVLYKPVIYTRRTPPPRRPPTIEVPRGSSTPNLKEKHEGQISERDDDRLQHMRTKLQQQIIVNFMAKPRHLPPLQPNSKLKRAPRVRTVSMTKKATWQRQRLRQLRSIYETMAA